MISIGTNTIRYQNRLFSRIFFYMCIIYMWLQFCKQKHCSKWDITVDCCCYYFSSSYFRGHYAFIRMYEREKSVLVFEWVMNIHHTAHCICSVRFSPIFILHFHNLLGFSYIRICRLITWSLHSKAIALCFGLFVGLFCHATWKEQKQKQNQKQKQREKKA